MQRFTFDSTPEATSVQLVDWIPRPALDATGPEMDILRRAKGLIDAKRYDDALAEMDSFSPERSRCWFVQEVRALIHDRGDNRQEQMAVSREMIDDELNFSVPWLHLAYAVKELRGVDNAKLVINEALGRFPECPMVNWLAGSIYTQSGDTKAGITLLGKTMELYDRFPDRTQEERTHAASVAVDKALADKSWAPLHSWIRFVSKLSGYDGGKAVNN